MEKYWTGNNSKYVHKVDEEFNWGRESKENKYPFYSFHFSEIDDIVQEYRNIKIEFNVNILEENENPHAALLFRKIDSYTCYGIGLGGWLSQFSFFKVQQVVPYNYLFFERVLFGNCTSIEYSKPCEFEIECRGNTVNHVKCNGKEVFQDIRLASFTNNEVLLSGKLGLYAFGDTNAEIEIMSKSDKDEDKIKLPVTCFFIHRIGDEPYKGRIAEIEQIINSNNKKIKIELVDADLSGTSKHQGVMNTVLESMKKADFIIADYREIENYRANIPYETGIAHSMNIPTILIVNKREEFQNYFSDLKDKYLVLDKNKEKELPVEVEKILNEKKRPLHYL